MRRRGNRRRAFGEGAARPRLRPPLQTEWLDIAVEKSQRTAPLVREIRKIAESESFRSAIDAIEGYEATNTGAIVYES